MSWSPCQSLMAYGNSKKQTKKQHALRDQMNACGFDQHCKLVHTQNVH